MSPESHDVTTFLLQWSNGDKSALERLTPLVYSELHRLAARHLVSERHDHTLQPTALVHEAYLRLISWGPTGWDGRNHFYAFAARLMRQVLVDHARKHRSAKRGSGLKAKLEEATLVTPASSPALLILDEALERLSQFDPRKGRIIELRYFAGMQIDETAGTMGLSTATVRRELRLAEAWLHRAMCGEAPEDS
jgi:RNA polymerase sigma-70 factor, ECF subfamily